MSVDLEQLVTGLAARPEVFRQLIRHDPEQRVYHRIPVAADATVWLICWMPGHDTGFHDHDGSAGAVAVLRGAVREERLRLGGPPSARVLRAGEVFTFGGADIHRVVGVEPAVTIHAYAPVLRRMGAYEFDEDGNLRRHALDETTELQPRVSDVVLS
jgi:predicted metal-dependent enzyme (double-stranded beta helix superfamily)